MDGKTVISRRQVLQRAGLAAGAAAGAGVLPTDTVVAQQASPDAVGGPTVRPWALTAGGPVVAAAPAVNPAWTYLTLSYDAFMVVGSGGTMSVDGNGLHASSPTTVRAPLHLPHGATVREVTFWVYNGSPGTMLSVGLSALTPPSISVGGTFAFTEADAGHHNVTMTSFASVNPIDTTTRAFALSSFLQSGTLHGLVGARIAYTPPSLTYVPLAAQERKLDTRLLGPLTGIMSTGETRLLSLAPEVPTGTGKVALVNVTVVGTQGRGFLTLYPGGTTNPGTSTINWATSGLVVANSATVAVSSSATVAISCGGPAGAQTHVVVDLIGYYA